MSRLNGGMDPSSLAAQTVDRARSALQTTRIASLPEVVKLLRALSGNSQDVTVVELAEVIQGDPLVMAQVIGAANTYAYNPNNIEVTSVTQAIHVIGYARIRTLAMSLMLAEQVSRTHSPDAQREYAAQSLMAGCIAQKLATGRATLDKQQAFICAALRNFGQIVLTSCMPDEFQQLREEAKGEPSDDAYRDMFGLTPLELGHELLNAANLPEEILATLRAIPPAAFAALKRSPEDQMRALTAFAGELAALTLDPRSDPADFPAKSDALARRYEQVLPGLHEEIYPLMDSTSEQMDQIIRSFRVKSLPARVTTRLIRCRNMVDPNRVVAAPPPPAAPANPEPAAPAPGKSALEPLVLPAHHWEQDINQFAVILRRSGTTRADIYSPLVESMRAGLGAPDCLLFGASPSSKAFPLSAGVGGLYRDLRIGPDLAIATGERTIFGVCLSRNENIIIHQAREEKIQAYLPSWLKGHPKIGAFIALPLNDGVRTAGVLFAAWPEARQIVLPPEVVKSVRMMLALACRAAARLG